ncbi:UNVERIFIED_CONTAM: hypothetical protein Sradi_3012100 [Sesamum radiatum]|uniref:Reverse transcriptase domain-containing protein n=1 Tax=Sesamum radiatum TaxID=300843 RepID=A0AAW2S3H2_SESRA
MVALNGSLHGFFPVKKGLRQGDLMSPALFLLCTKFFSRLIKRNTSNFEFNFHPKCEKLKITHLLFADDLMLFSRGDLPSIRILMECLWEFRDVFGLAVNTSKSSIFTADTLWVKWVNEVYLRGVSLWDWQPKKGDSPLLRRLADILDRFITAFISPKAVVQCMADWSNTKGLETSKAYEYFRPKLMRQSWKTVIWKAFIPPKYSFILWLGLRGRLATRDRHAFLQEEYSYSFCINTMESVSHLFFACPFSVHVWTNIRQWLGITRRMSTLPSEVKWLKKEKTGSSVQNKARVIALACMVYSLWRHRNKFIFEGKAPP